MFSRGFTLIELMVTVAIFVFMTALLLANYNGFSQGTLLANMAYDIATTVRIAQSYGTSVLESSQGSSNFSSAYGVEFSSTASGGASPTTFVLFKDSSNTGVFDDTTTNTLKTYTLKNGATINSVQVCPKAYSAPSCVTTTGVVDVTFSRPNPEANIAWNKDGTGTKIDTGAGYVFIKVLSGNGKDSRTVEIQHNGQISVTN